jgi:hypothetical protein
MNLCDECNPDSQNATSQECETEVENAKRIIKSEMATSQSIVKTAVYVPKRNISNMLVSQLRVTARSFRF